MAANGRTNGSRYTGGLVDTKDWFISREIFVNEEIYQEELEQLFARAWLFIGHESQVPKPGDFFVSRMGEESVILTRDRQEKVHVFLNTCRHRGMKVCRYDEGNTPVFTCPYHGWSYATDGKLVGVPHFKMAYHEELDKSRFGLVEVTQMANYKGSIWANWDADAPPFEEYMGHMLGYLDPLLDATDGGDGGTEVLAGVHKWLMPCNWKWGAENFIGDFYHNISHRSVDLTNMSPSGKGRFETSRISSRRIQVTLPGGHGTGRQLPDSELPQYQSAYPNLPIVDEYLRNAHETRVKRLGKKSRLQGGVGTVFPNMSIHVNRTIAVWHPAGALRTEAWRWYLVDKEAPPEVKDAILHYYMRYSGPAGLTEQDDMENWNYASAASQGTIARRYPYYYGMGLGHSNPDSELPGNANEVMITEQNQRGMYDAWAKYMDAGDWGQLAVDLGCRKGR